MMNTMESLGHPNQESAFRRWWNGLTFMEKRMFRFFMTMASFMICLPLYHLGFFGTREGPLHPATIGDALAGMGVSKAHSMAFFLSFLIIAISWNWIFNLVSYVRGSRLTCDRPEEGGGVCGARAEKEKVVQKKSGMVAIQYVCDKGHKRAQAHFHPVQKGTAGHTVWVTALIFCVIVFFLS